MSKIHKVASLAICAVTSSLACGIAAAGDSTQACPYVSSIQRKIVEHADAGMGSLRSYVWATDATVGIDMNDVKQNLDSWRAAVECRKELARAESKVDVAIKADEPRR